MMYHFDVKSISRSQNQSVIRRTVYITGRTLYDYRMKREICNQREDVKWHDILLPPNASPVYKDLQHLTNEMERVETRSNARTGKQYIANLPRNLPRDIQIQMVKDFIEENFTNSGLCAIAAIHDGKHETDAKKDNPHVHIIVSTRVLEEDKFGKKDRVLDTKSHLIELRSRWANTQNREYERIGFPDRVTSERKKDRFYEHEHELEHDFDHEHDGPSHTR